MGKRIDISGQTFGLLTVIEYAGRRIGGSNWLVECECGERKISGSLDLRHGHVTTCGIKGRHTERPQNPYRYHAVHVLVNRHRGRASAHSCVDCGGPAREWSYIGKTGVSEDIEDFEPRCRPCHLVYDGRNALVTA